MNKSSSWFTSGKSGSPAKNSSEHVFAIQSTIGQTEGQIGRIFPVSGLQVGNLKTHTTVLIKPLHALDWGSCQTMLCISTNNSLTSNLNVFRALWAPGGSCAKHDSSLSTGIQLNWKCNNEYVINIMYLLP